jgi:hypothetical protein
MARRLGLDYWCDHCEPLQGPGVKWCAPAGLRIPCRAYRRHGDDRRKVDVGRAHRVGDWYTRSEDERARARRKQDRKAAP